MPAPAADSVQIVGPPLPDTPRVLTPEALAFIADLQRRFGPERQTLLATRRARRSAFRAGTLPDFIRDTISIREGPWRVAPAPADLDDRRVEITGPVERKMMINAFNSGAKVFMGDFEDALSPTWENVIAGQGNCQDAVRRTMTFTAPDGREFDFEAMLSPKWSSQDWQDSCLCRAAPRDLVACIGSGHQRLYVIPSLELVIVRHGRGGRFSDAQFLRLLLSK